MKHCLSFLFAVVVLLTLPVQALTNQPATTLNELQKWLSEHVSNPQLNKELLGEKMVSIDSGKTIFEHNATKLFSPASNCKLYTVALALDKLGGDYRIKTSLYA